MQRPRQRPKRFGEQRRAATSELRKRKPRGSVSFLVPSKKLSPMHTEYRRFQKKRINLRYAFSLIESEDIVLKQLARQAIVNAKPSMLAKYLTTKQLAKLSRNPDLDVKKVAANELAKVYVRLGEKGIRELERLSKDYRWEVREAAANGLVKVYVGLGKKGIRELERMSRDYEWDVREAAANGLVKVYVGLGKKGIRELERLSKDPTFNVKRVAVNGLVKV
ncbi:MAG: HEAT repeat domain-containing protein, partial [archaeon]